MPELTPEYIAAMRQRAKLTPPKWDESLKLLAHIEAQAERIAALHALADAVRALPGGWWRGLDDRGIYCRHCLHWDGDHASYCPAAAVLRAQEAAQEAIDGRK